MEVIETFQAHHVSLTVRDMSTSVAFYCSFGFKVVYTYATADGKRRISHLRLGEFMLELFELQPQEANSTASNRDIAPIGIHHFALQAASITDAYKIVADYGYECDPIATGLSSLKYFFVRDPDGIWFEIVEDKR